MSEFKGTPGPWEPAKHGPSGLVYGIRGWHGTESVNVVNWGGISRPASSFGQANAHLIAAAPELLEALIWMVENDETNEGDEPLPDHNGSTWNEINSYWISGLNRARAAIAKATGEQP